MITSFMSDEELVKVGFRSLGREAKISRFARIYAPEVIDIGSRVRIDDFCLLSGGVGIRFGSCIHVSAYSAIFGGGGVTVEDFVSISAGVMVFSESDDYSGMSLTNPTIPSEFKPTIDRAPVRFERHSIVGTGSAVMPGVVLEEGAAVGALSLVSETCPRWSVSCGVPARVIRKRDEGLLEQERRFLRHLRDSGDGWLADRLECR